MENSILRTLKNFSLMERQIPICRGVENIMDKKKAVWKEVTECSRQKM